jgi:hypothetical protein
VSRYAVNQLGWLGDAQGMPNARYLSALISAHREPVTQVPGK